MTSIGAVTTRRTVLASSVVLPLGLLAACGSDDGAKATDTDDAVRSSVASDEHLLIEQYNAVIAAFPSLSAKLTPIRDQHQQHLSAMKTPAPSATASPSPAPTSQSSAISMLTSAERKAAATRTDSCVQATKQDLVWTLSLIAASEASHAASLSGLAG